MIDNIIYEYFGLNMEKTTNIIYILAGPPDNFFDHLKNDLKIRLFTFLFCLQNHRFNMYIVYCICIL